MSPAEALEALKENMPDELAEEFSVVLRYIEVLKSQRVYGYNY